MNGSYRAVAGAERTVCSNLRCWRQVSVYVDQLHVVHWELKYLPVRSINAVTRPFDIPSAMAVGAPRSE